MRVILASQSKYRRELVARSGIAIESLASPFDEDAAKPALRGLPAGEFALALARGKADALANEFPDALIIGSDQVAELDGEILGKPGTEANARAQLARLAGREHQIITATCVMHRASGRREESLDVHAMKMRALDPAQIVEYVRRDAPLDCAGSYRVESFGAALFESMAGDDFTAIVGLPLTRLVTLLDRFGVRPFTHPQG